MGRLKSVERCIFCSDERMVRGSGALKYSWYRSWYCSIGSTIIENWNDPKGVPPFSTCRSPRRDCRWHVNDHSQIADDRWAEERCSQDIWVHQECLLTLGVSYQTPNISEPIRIVDVWELAQSIELDYDSREKQHTTRELCSLREGLKSTYVEAFFPQERFFNLPEELQVMILEWIRPCAFIVILGESRRLIDCIRARRLLPGRGEEELLNMSQKIYATRIEFQGNSYLSQLSNSPLQSSATLMHDGSKVKTVRVLVDHVGILDLQFSHRSSETLEVSARKAPWYQFVEHTNGDWLEEIRVKSNVRRAQWSSARDVNFQILGSLPKERLSRPGADQSCQVGSFSEAENKWFQHLPTHNSTIPGACVSISGNSISLATN